MIFKQEDTKITLNKFMGLYSRGTLDEVPQDHAVVCQDVVFPSGKYIKTRDGITKCFESQGAAIRRFFLSETLPPNYGEPDATPGVTDGYGLLYLDDSNNLYIGNDATPIYVNAAMNDFAAINVGNRTYISGFDRFVSNQLIKLQVFNPLTGSIRNAAGLAPVQSSDFLAAANSATTGDVPAGIHQIAVIYQTDTGFWTQPGPKKNLACTPTASASDTDPTTFACTAHGMITGESHTIYGGTGAWTEVSDTWYITRIDDDHFSIPLDSHSFGAVTGTFTVDAGFTAATVTADGTHAIDVSNIPTGPTGTIAQLLLATQSGGAEFFFVPNVPGSQSTILNNTTTTATINFFDTDLVASADYLFDIMEVIPAGTSLCKYRGRLVLVGANWQGLGTAERVFLSNIGDPETFNFVSGYIQVQTESDGNDPAASFVLRDTLYICKFTGTFATEDNGNDPSTWAITVVDIVIGTYSYGTSAFTVSQSGPDTGDIVLIASKVGLVLFNGVMRRPELSYKIQAIWDRIPFDYFYRVTVAHDPWNHLIYISCPLDDATEPNTLLVCDYTDGRDSVNVKWSIYNLSVASTCIGMIFFGSSIAPQLYTLKIGSLASNYLYFLDPTATSDDANTKIASKYQFAFLNLGGVGFWKMINVRGVCTGPLGLQLNSEDQSVSTTLSALSPSAG